MKTIKSGLSKLEAPYKNLFGREYTKKFCYAFRNLYKYKHIKIF